MRYLGIIFLLSLGSAEAFSRMVMPPMDRQIVGMAAEYHPVKGATPKTLEEERAFAWRVVQEVVRPVALPRGGSVPAFQTWYGKDELGRVFPEVLRQRLASPVALGDVKKIFEWNSTSARQFRSWNEAVFSLREEAFQDPHASHSLGQDQRILFSPALAAHLISNYQAMVDCLKRSDWPADEDLEATANFSPCLGTEAPLGSAVIKARWVPVKTKVEIVRTDADSLISQIQSGSWAAPSSQEIPQEKSHWGEDPVSGASKQLLAMHIAVKDLRDWVWITLWWSPAPAEMSEGRPKLQSVWNNYEMCAVTSYRGLPSERVVDNRIHKATGGDSWCSNPYIEVEAGNARTSCIGCHQHAGTSALGPQIIADESKFPGHGRRKVRRNFPSDYLWSFNRDIEVARLFKTWVEAQ